MLVVELVDFELDQGHVFTCAVWLPKLEINHVGFSCVFVDVRAFEWQTPIHNPSSPIYPAILLITQRAAFFLISNYSAN